MSTTSFMSLELPVVSTTEGPDWASLLNSAFETIDSHDHSSGKGLQITPSGLNINSDLSIGENNLTNVNSLRLFENIAALGGAEDLACLYNVSGELYYNDGLGNQIQLTSSGGLNASSIGGIGGDYASSSASLSYSSANQTYIFEQSAGVNGNIDVAHVLLREATASANAVKLESPNSLAASYDLTFPNALPGTTLPILSTSAGALSFAQIDTAQIADNAVSQNKISSSAITRDKIADLEKVPPGVVQMFHTFNNTVALPRGWMKLNGDIVNQTNYDAIHGVGAYAADGVAASSLNGVNLPNIINKYAVGVSNTTQDGSSAITSVGNSGNTINLQHDHGSINSRKWHEFGSASPNNGYSFNSDNFANLSVFGSHVSTSGSDTGLLVGTGSASSLSGVSGVYNDDAGVEMPNDLSTSQSIQPESIELIYIIKVV
jgi:hypothetical protein